MSLTRVVLGLTAGTALAVLVVTAPRGADAAGDEAEPVRSAQREKPGTADPPSGVAPPAASALSSSPAPAAWSPPQGPRVTAGVIARAARSAQEREAATPPKPERRRVGKARGGGKIISLEIDWNAATTAP